MQAFIRNSVALHNLLGGLIDYAGLFPPAALDMPRAVANYRRYATGHDVWALGRFVVPAARLGEIPEPMSVSVLLTDPEKEIPHLPAWVDTIELKASSAESIRPWPLTTYYEIPIADDPAPLIATIARSGCRAKVRTGGTTADAFPKSGDLLRFLQGCLAAGVAFKATAGLHHPWRGEHALTYEHHSPHGLMHGFLNVFMTAVFLWSGVAVEAVGELLEERSEHALALDDTGCAWRGYRVSAAQIAQARQEFAIAFGSCSFEEPLDDLRTSGWL